MEYKHDIPCSRSKLSELRSFVKEVLYKHEVPEIKAHEIVLAVDEVCSNLVIHSNGCDPREHVQLKINVKGDNVLEFVFSDQGIAFDERSYHEPELKELIQKKKKGGLGVLLVKKIMDHIEYSREKNKNICRLVKKI